MTAPKGLACSTAELNEGMRLFAYNIPAKLLRPAKRRHP
jgi:hypothetical protein